MTTQRERDREQAIEELEKLEALIVEQSTAGTLRPLTIQARVRSIAALLVEEPAMKARACPFCGSTSRSLCSDYNHMRAWVECIRCSARGPILCEGPEQEVKRKATEAWNRRVVEY